MQRYPRDHLAFQGPSDSRAERQVPGGENQCLVHLCEPGTGPRAAAHLLVGTCDMVLVHDADQRSALVLTRPGGARSPPRPDTDLKSWHRSHAPEELTFRSLVLLLSPSPLQPGAGVSGEQQGPCGFLVLQMGRGEGVGRTARPSSAWIVPWPSLLCI